MKLHRKTYAQINLDHLSFNVQSLRKFIKRRVPQRNVFFCPMVKANAYGHGDVQAGLQLDKEKVTGLGVGLVEEGIHLRLHKIRSPLLVFGVFGESSLRDILHYNLTPVISAWPQLQMMRKSLKRKNLSLPVHIKFDTGMHRLGFLPKEADKVLDIFNESPQFQLSGVMTHLYKGEDADDPEGESQKQLNFFSPIVHKFSKGRPHLVHHSLNSAGLLNLYSLQKSNWFPQGVRPGLAIYGVSPFQGHQEKNSEKQLSGYKSVINGNQSFPKLKPVMSLHSQIVHFHSIPKGEGVSYGHTWKARRKSLVGVIPMGYADGYTRLFSNKAFVLYNGKKVPVIGNVCMDYAMIDITDAVHGASLESVNDTEVTLFGADSFGNVIKVNELATIGKTIPWEILTSVSERVPRLIKK